METKWAWLLGFLVLAGISVTLFVEKSKDQKDLDAVRAKDPVAAPAHESESSTAPTSGVMDNLPPASSMPPPAYGSPEPPRDGAGQFGSPGLNPPSNANGADPNGYQMPPPGGGLDAMPPNYDSLPPPPAPMYPDADGFDPEGGGMPAPPPQFDGQPVPPGYEEFVPPPPPSPQEEDL